MKEIWKDMKLCDNSTYIRKLTDKIDSNSHHEIETFFLIVFQSGKIISREK